MASELTTKVFSTVDSGDTAAFGRFFAERGRMVFANGDPMYGPDEIRAGVAAFFGTIKALRHTIIAEWVVGHDTITELSVEYDRLDDKTVTIPVVSIWHVDDAGKIDDYRVFFDLAPVYA